MKINAAMVKELRERTGAGMMDCKKALQESEGDIEGAIEFMRKSGMAKAAKKAGRIAAEGAIVMQKRSGGAEAVLVEVNCETDFVAKDESFLAFAEAVARTALAARVDNAEALAGAPMADAGGATVEECRQQLVTKIGENVSVRRCTRMRVCSGRIGAYVHGRRIGVLVAMEGGDDDLARDIAMHVAASRPLCVSEAEVPAESVAKEREIYAAQAAETGKPPGVVDNMVQGRLAKYLREVALLGQPFVKDPEIPVGELLAEKGATVREFVRLEVGEGIEKKSGDFAAEVAAQANIHKADPPRGAGKE